MNPQTMAPLALAFLGDAIMSVKAREHVLSLGYHKPVDFQKETIKYVSAKSQAKFVEGFLATEEFSEEELAVFKRGRNAKSLTIPKNTDMMTYKLSTGYEALWGYLYLKGEEERLNELFAKMVEMRNSL